MHRRIAESGSRFTHYQLAQLIFTSDPLIVLMPDASTSIMAPFTVFLALASELIVDAVSSILAEPSILIFTPLIVISPPLVRVMLEAPLFSTISLLALTDSLLPTSRVSEPLTFAVRLPPTLELLLAPT